MSVGLALSSRRCAAGRFAVDCLAWASERNRSPRQVFDRRYHRWVAENEQQVIPDHDRRARLNQRLRQAFIEGAEEESRRRLGRGLTVD